jgi:RHS repeat-associated protein
MSISSRDGYSVRLIYDPETLLLHQVESDDGRYLQFEYDAKRRIQKIVGYAGQTWGYEYDAEDNLRYVLNPDATPNDDTDNPRRQYHYNEPAFTSGADLPHALTGITDERGIRYATYEYYPDGRAKASYHADNAQRVDITYNDSDGTRTVTNSRGQQSTYSTAVQHGVALVTDISGPGCSTCSTGNTSYQYDPVNNNLLSRTENGVTTQYDDYDDKGQYGYKIEAVGTPEERRTDYSYDPRFFHKITTITEPSVAPGQQKITTYTYDDWANRRSETVNGFRPDGTPVSRSTTWEYEGPLHQLSRMDGARTDVADITTYDYYPDDPAQGPNRARLRKVTDATGVAVRDQIQYTPTGKVMSESRPNSLTLAYSYYPGNDRLETLTESDGTSSHVTLWTYLATGEVESITQAHGSPGATTLAFGYDDARRLTSITDGLGNYIEYQLDTEGNREAERIHDASGILKKQLTQTFDLYNRLDTRTQANELIDQDMAPNGTLDLSTDGRGAVTDYGYDALKRLTQVVQDQSGGDPTTSNATILYGYDTADRLTSVTDPIGGNTGYVYDDLGNLLSQTSPDTGTTSFTHDAAGNVITRNEAKGQAFHYAYDALNRVTEVDGPGFLADLSYQYDTCAGGNGRLCRVSNPDAVVHYGYDGFGNPTRLPGLRYAYDGANRLRTLTYPSGARVTYHYDAAGQVERMELTVNGVTQTLADTITHLPFGPVSQLEYGNGLALTQTFDTAYRMQSQTVPNVLALTYPEYDPTGNLLGREDGLGGTPETYSYDPLSRLDTAAGPFGARDYTHDLNGNRTDLDGTAYGYTPNSNRLAAIGSADVLLDDNGNTLNQGSWTFDYNAHNRLIAAYDDGVLAATYAYNGLGQRTRKLRADGRGRHFLYGTSGELLAETDIDGNILNEYLYLNGQLIALYQPDDSGNGLTNAEEDVFGTNPANVDRDGDGLLDRDEWFWIGTDARMADTDGDGVLDGEEQAAGTDPLSASSYPGDGDVNQDGRVDVGDLLLVTQIALGQRTPTPEQFIRADINRDGVVDVVDVLLLQRRILGLSFLELFHDLPGSQTLLAVIDGARDGIQLAAHAFHANLIGTAQAAVSNGKLYYVHTDHLGTPKALTDESGNRVWSAVHDPFGMAVVDPGSTVEMNVRFPGQYYDSETRLHYNAARYYNPSTGRYITTDPIGLNGGVNPFIYAYANPIILIDPDGLRGFSPAPRPGPQPNFGRPNRNEQGFRNREKYGSPYGRHNQNPPLPRPPIDPFNPAWREIHEQLESLENPGEKGRIPDPSPETNFIEVCDAWACPNGPVCPDYTVHNGHSFMSSGSNDGCFCVRTKKVPIAPQPSNWRFY